MKNSTALWLLALMVLIWGLAAPINKMGVSHTLPSNYVELSFAIATLAMFLIAWLCKHLRVPTKKDIPIILTVGLSQMAVMMTLSIYGLSLVGAGRAAFLVFTTSVWVIPISACVARKISFLKGLSFLLGMGGICCLIQPWKIDDITQFTGYMALLLSAFSWALGIVCARYMRWHHLPIELIPWQLFLAALCTIAIAWFQGVSFFPPSIELSFIGCLFYTAIISIAIGYWLLILVGKQLSPAITSLALLFVPILSLCISALFLHEQISLNVVWAAALLTIGSVIDIVF